MENTKSIFNSFYLKYLEQGMDEFEAKHRAVQHIVKPPQPELTQDDIEIARKYYEFRINFQEDPQNELYSMVEFCKTLPKGTTYKGEIIS